MRKRLAIVLGLTLALMLGAGVAWASIPGSDGVIHGCYKTSGPSAGSLIVVDSAASCPSGYTALNWASGPPSGTLYNVAAQSGSVTVVAGTNAYQVTCPGTRRLISAVAQYADGPLYVDLTGGASSLGQTATIYTNQTPAGAVATYEIICADRTL